MRLKRRPWLNSSAATVSPSKQRIRLQNGTMMSYIKKFKAEVKLPMKYLDKMYKSKLAAHFYSGQETRTFYEKWE